MQTVRKCAVFEFGGVRKNGKLKTPFKDLVHLGNLSTVNAGYSDLWLVGTIFDLAAL